MSDRHPNYGVGRKRPDLSPWMAGHLAAQVQRMQEQWGVPLREALEIAFRTNGIPATWPAGMWGEQRVWEGPFPGGRAPAE